jgi:Methyltransferase domain
MACSPVGDFQAHHTPRRRVVIIGRMGEPTLPPRSVEPEWLDVLPADDPRAVRSRRDLRLVNRIMGHGRVIRRALRQHRDAGRPRIAEIGAGDGTLLLRVLKGRSPCEVVLVDRQPCVNEKTQCQYRDAGLDLRIEAADVFAWLEAGDEEYDAIVANLFLHHFGDHDLTELLARVARRTRLFIACEPLRGRVELIGSRLLGLLGCNDVTRHDAVASVRAGFRGSELSQHWPGMAGWTLTERRAGLFSHYFSAARS